jgi:hypothetical protein
MATSRAEKMLDPETLAGMMSEGINPRRMVPTTVDRMPPTTAGLPSLMMFTDPALKDTNTGGYVLRSSGTGTGPAMSQALFMRPFNPQESTKDTQDTVAHETEHLLARQNLGDPAAINRKFDELVKDKNIRTEFVSNAVSVAPYLKEKYGMQSGYFSPKMVEFQGRRAPNLLYEQLAVLSSIEQVNNVDLTKDPVLRETLFKSPAVRETYNALTGLRQTRLDPRDLPPYERLPEPTIMQKMKKVLNFSKGGMVERNNHDNRSYK